jgi:uncharacterized protein YcbK (DUF882 family)
VVLSCSRYNKILAAAVLSVLFTGGATAAPVMRASATAASLPPVVVVPTDSLHGRSGKLLARIVRGERDGSIRILRELFGDSTSARPGVYTAADSASGRSFSFISLLPFSAKQRGRVGSYLIGNWPRERRAHPEALPAGFIEVTPGNQDTRVSEHFTLRDFLTHDQQAVWPKYLVLDENLIDKLELIITDLELRGHRVDHLQVMSGFRTPQYNARGVRPGGRASDSRHQYGDAADVFVDNDRNGRMDDLNRDGRIDIRDTRLLLQAVERVERKFPDLVGGAGLYRAHGGFVHVDVRGSRARWGLS